jgi:hypothetical protein
VEGLHWSETSQGAAAVAGGDTDTVGTVDEKAENRRPFHREDPVDGDLDCECQLHDLMVPENGRLGTDRLKLSSNESMHR